MSKIYSGVLVNQEISSDQSDDSLPSVSEIQQINSQVKIQKPRAIRRQFSVSDKKRIIADFDACNGSLERGALLRKEGLYYASISKWKKELSDKKSSRESFKSHQRDLEHQQLLRENARLKKKLSQAEAIIEIQKKVSKLLSEHVLDQETSEVKS
jgi:hypothetical protein